jgi:hypothetical protein
MRRNLGRLPWDELTTRRVTQNKYIFLDRGRKGTQRSIASGFHMAPVAAERLLPARRRAWNLGFLIVMDEEEAAGG